MKIRTLLSLAMIVVSASPSYARTVYSETYLRPLIEQMQTEWPANRTVNIVFHGHSVPAGYFVTPDVNTIDSYPHMTLMGLKSRYHLAVINTIVTAVGGENSESGARRFKSEVLTMRPDVVFIDYALNDRGISLEKARESWTSMIEAALDYGCKVILMTPTPDTAEDVLDESALLAVHSRQIRSLAREYGVGLVDSYAIFGDLIRGGDDIIDYMSQNNHPNKKGHAVVARGILDWFGIKDE